jgi:hypothetical protein
MEEEEGGGLFLLRCYSRLSRREDSDAGGELFRLQRLYHNDYYGSNTLLPEYLLSRRCGSRLHRR